MSDHAIALTTMALDAGIFLFLVGVEVWHAKTKRVRAICPECLEEHDVRIVHAGADRDTVTHGR